MILKYKTNNKQSILETSTIGPVLKEIKNLNPDEVLNFISSICKATEYIEKEKKYSYYADINNVLALILLYYEEPHNRATKKAIEN